MPTTMGRGRQAMHGARRPLLWYFAHPGLSPLLTFQRSANLGAVAWGGQISPEITQVTQLYRDTIRCAIELWRLFPKDDPSDSSLGRESSLSLQQTLLRQHRYGHARPEPQSVNHSMRSHFL